MLFSVYVIRAGAVLVAVIAILGSVFRAPLEHLLFHEPFSEEELREMLAVMVNITRPDAVGMGQPEGMRKNGIAVCCSVDLDVSVRAVDLLRAMKVEVRSARHHERVHTLTELGESFGFYFKQGAAAEQSMVRFVCSHPSYGVTSSSHAFISLAD